MPSEAVFQIAGTYNVWAINPEIGAPGIAFLLGADPSTASNEKNSGRGGLSVGERIWWQIDSSKRILVTRLPDSANFKEFEVVLGIPGQLATKNTDDKQDKKDKDDNNDNNKRRRKRGGGGLSNTDRRTRPVDRLLD